MKLCSLLGTSILLASLSLAAHHPVLDRRAYTPPTGSPGFYHGNSSAAVTFDNLSAFIDNKRVFIFSGEFHPWRSPAGPSAWRDVLQKFKAAGFNAVSIYLHWGLTEGKQGVLDFTQFRSHTEFYKVAQEVGIFVVTRPGPYINAEAAGGGFPGWTTNNGIPSRTNATEWKDLWTAYITNTAKFAAPFQYPDGPIISMQVENEFGDTDETRANYMVQLEDTMRSNGITKVPLINNDPGVSGTWAKGLGSVDLYMFDAYPGRYACGNPAAWQEVVAPTTMAAQHRNDNPDELWATAEFQGGALDPWGGAGYEGCYELLNEQFANVFYKNNYAATVRWQNFYMAQGGTNWGNIPYPGVYTSYDYGSAIREDRTLTPKYSEVKLQAEFLHASEDLFTSSMIFSGAGHTDNAAIYTTYLQGQNGTAFYVFRQTTNNNTSPESFTAPVNVSNSVVTIPQFGSKITLAGRESKILVTNFRFGSAVLQYSTAEVMTWTVIDAKEIIILYALEGQSVEAVFSSKSSSALSVSGSSISAKAVNGTVQITGSTSGVSTVSFGSTVVIVTDKITATTMWNIRLAKPVTPYDMAPSVPSVLVMGPYLVRNATISGSTLKLFGDINTTTPISFLAPKSVTHLTWNGKSVALQNKAIGMKGGMINFTLKTPALPNLGTAKWSCVDSLPEVTAGFDDSSWVTANKTSVARPFPPYAGEVVLYADEYGFHQGNSLFRGHFDGNATAMWLSVQGGNFFAYSAWINDIFMGSSTASTDTTNVTWTFPAGSLKSTDNVVTVVFDQTGLEEDYFSSGSFRTPRGIRGYNLTGSTFKEWKVVGNFGGEDHPDTVRGPLNEGGLYVERIGAHLPGFKTTGWKSGSSCGPASTGIPKAGITAFRTTFNLNLPSGSDIPIALKVDRDPSNNYRSVIYINGWQFGRFNSVSGPQDTFPLPQGILNHNGQNTLLVTLWSLDAAGAKMGALSLVTTASIQSSRDVPPRGVVESPTFQQIRE